MVPFYEMVSFQNVPAWWMNIYSYLYYNFYFFHSPDCFREPHKLINVINTIKAQYLLRNATSALASYLGSWEPLTEKYEPLTRLP